MNVSVIITHYNHQKYLADAVWSAAMQTRRPFELIVVDDGSTEPPDLRWIRDLFQQATTVSVPHRGIGAALNVAIAIMRGDVFCWLPADDLWKPQKLAMQSAFAADHPGCVLHSYVDVWQDAAFDRVGEVPNLSDEAFAEAIRHSSPYYASTFWVPREVLGTVGPFREDVPASEDYQWVLRSVVRHGVKYRLQPEPLAVKRRHSDTTTARHGAEIPALVEQFNREL